MGNTEKYPPALGLSISSSSLSLSTFSSDHNKEYYLICISQQLPHSDILVKVHKIEQKLLKVG